VLERVGPFDLVYERYSLWSFAAMEYAKAIGVPGLLEVNAPLIEEQAKYRGLVDRAGAERAAVNVLLRHQLAVQTRPTSSRSSGVRPAPSAPVRSSAGCTTCTNGRRDVRPTFRPPHPSRSARP
jgi:hypothetical protein